jgi:hypothetical protein
MVMMRIELAAFVLELGIVSLLEPCPDYALVSFLAFLGGVIIA